MSRSLRAAAAATTLALVLCTATAAFAAPVAWESVDVTLQSEDAGAAMVIAGNLPTSAKLPAQIELSAPAGARELWMGQVLGGALADDPTLDFVKRSVSGVDVYAATLTQSRTAQLEVETIGASTTDGTNYTASLSWASVTDLPRVVLSVRLPADAKITSATAGATLYPGGADGFSYYSQTFQNVKAGRSLSLALAYSATAVTATPTVAATSGSDNTLLVTLLLVVLVAVALFLVAMAVRSSRTPPVG